MTILYGTIGYTILNNTTTNKKIIIFADRHDNLPSCPDNIDIAEWFKQKSKSSKILLEEVPRGDVDLQELWSTAAHTQSLKKLYLENPTVITGLDIRPLLIPFSWELISNTELDSNYEHLYNKTFKEYIKNINNFFSMKETFLLNNLLNYNVNKLKNTKLGKHFKKLKKIYNQILIKYSLYLNDNIKSIKINRVHILDEINDLLDEIMEWNICANILLYNNESVIVHVGLAHSEKIILLLKTHYKYSQTVVEAINKLDDAMFKSISGCVQLHNNLASQFGGVDIIAKIKK